MKAIIGTSNRILEVDLTRSKVDICEVKPRERRLYLGGKGLGLKLLYDRMRAGADPLGEENIIAFMPGVLMGTGAPCSGRFAAVTKSPLTGIMVPPRAVDLSAWLSRPQGGMVCLCAAKQPHQPIC
jgi:aldehyde:ferredoxin oxidoreductase